MSVETHNEQMQSDAPHKNTGPFAVHFDDFRRKMLTRGIVLTKLMTASPGTDDYTAYMAAFEAVENDTVEVCVEDDHRTTTFYTVKYPTAPVTQTGTDTNTEEQK